MATLGAAGVEGVRDALAETQSASVPLVPYLDTLRWMFIAVAELKPFAWTADPDRIIESVKRGKEC